MLCCADNYVTFHWPLSIFLVLAFYNYAYRLGPNGIRATRRCTPPGYRLPLTALTAGAVAWWYPFDTQIIKYSDGGVYEGEANGSTRNGYGRMNNCNGSVYEGEWKDNLPNGTGTMTYADGSTYAGEWKNGVESGYGTYTTSDGHVFSMFDGFYLDG